MLSIRSKVVGAGLTCLLVAGCNAPGSSDKTAGSGTHQQTPTKKVSGFTPRTDGLYWGVSTETPTKKWVLYTPEHKVYYAVTTSGATPDDVRAWLGPQCPASDNHGPWTYDKNGAFTVPVSGGLLNEYTVKNVTPNGFDMHVHSQYGGEHTSVYRMVFAPNGSNIVTVNCPD